MIDPRWIVPDWPAPAGVTALVTTRSGGWSDGPFGAPDGGGLNLGDGASEVSGAARDAPDRVHANRRHLKESIGVTPQWLTQVHGDRVLVLDGPLQGGARPPEADASVTLASGIACTVLTADCLPVLLCDDQARSVAAVHAGWRGMAAGIIQSAVRVLRQELKRPEARLLAYLGPAIGPCHFEVGPEVLAAMSAGLPGALSAFRPGPDGRAHADLFALARQCLASEGVEAVYGGGACTYCDAQRFFSYRRDRVTGRQGAMIWRV